MTATEVLAVIGGGFFLAAQSAFQQWQARQHAEKQTTAATETASKLGTNLGPRVQRLEERIAALEAMEPTYEPRRRRRR